MTIRVPSSRRRRQSPSRSKYRLQKPKGSISPRVKEVGGEHFAIVCVDPAKHRSEWMMADYFGNVLIEPHTLEHQAAFFKAAVALIRQAQREHDIQDLIVVVERTGNYYLPPKRAFADAGFETRVLHPFATKQYRQPADPGNKTDRNDLAAQHRAAAAGFGLCEPPLEPPYHTLKLKVRHRRNLVQKGASLACQIREHMHLSLPGYAALFDHLFEHKTAMAVGHDCDSPARVLELGHDGLARLLREHGLRHLPKTIDKILAWASQAVGPSIPDGPLHHAIWTDLEELYQHFQRRISAAEVELAGQLVHTPYVRLLAIPGINLVLAAELAGELGPITRYGNANAITGRCGLYPSRSQSDQTDHDRGPIIRQSNRRLRSALMRIADSLASHCAYYRGQAGADEARGIDKRATRVKIAKRFSRLAFACLAGNEPMRHRCFQQADSILEKLRAFHHEHHTPLDRMLADLQAAVSQLPGNTCRREAEIVAAVLERQSHRHRGGVAIGELLPAVLARLESRAKQEHEHRGRS
ncbi:MAG: IS110 family transposase [Planctomycetota bacterium]|nr:MAG: IS110 family transposase [Planctomycetota bacterium]